jgi:hypothetical protein
MGSPSRTTRSASREKAGAQQNLHHVPNPENFASLIPAETK